MTVTQDFSQLPSLQSHPPCPCAVYGHTPGGHSVSSTVCPKEDKERARWEDTDEKNIQSPSESPLLRGKLKSTPFFQWRSFYCAIFSSLPVDRAPHSLLKERLEFSLRWSPRLHQALPLLGGTCGRDFSG